VRVLIRHDAEQPMQGRVGHRQVGRERGIERRTFAPGVLFGLDQGVVGDKAAHHFGVRQARRDMRDGGEVQVDQARVEVEGLAARDDQTAHPLPALGDLFAELAGFPEAASEVLGQSAGLSCASSCQRLRACVGEFALAKQFVGELLPLRGDEAGRNSAFLLQFVHQIAGGDGDLAHRQELAAFLHGTIVRGDRNEQVGGKADTQDAGHRQQPNADRALVHGQPLPSGHAVPTDGRRRPASVKNVIVCCS
jgi:hypothetical protein